MVRAIVFTLNKGWQDVALQDAIANLPEVSLSMQVTFEHCSHWLYIEEPGNFSTIVMAFVTDNMRTVQKDMELCHAPITFGL